MERRKVLAGLFVVFAVTAVLAQQEGGEQVYEAPADGPSYLNLPEGFQAEVYAENLYGALNDPEPHGGANAGPRLMAFYDGTLFVAIPGEPYDPDTENGVIVALEDTNGDGTPDNRITVLDGLNRPNSLAFRSDHMYVGGSQYIFRYEMNGLAVVEGSRENLVEVRPGPDVGQWSTTMNVFDGSLWFTAGSGAKDQYSGKLTRCNLDGSGCETFATGFRNMVGFEQASNGQIVGTDNGMTVTEYPGMEDGAETYGDGVLLNEPPEEVNIIQQGNDYGWPFCYGSNTQIVPEMVEEGHDEHQDQLRNHQEQLGQSGEDPCQDVTPTTVNLDAHAVPLGMAFYESDQFPQVYQGDLFVAMHGCWDCGQDRGYSILRIECQNGEYVVSEFIDGWYNPDDETNPYGRPVDVAVGPDGDMFISDDTKGKIYRVWHDG